VGGIPTTSAARVICDLAASEPMAEVEQLLIDARVARCVTDRELYGVLDRTPGRAGAASMRALLADESEEGYSRSRAERLLRSLVKTADLPRPLFNRKLQGFLVDAVWPAHPLVLEVDSERFHGHRAAFEADRRRDQILVAAGYAVIRVTWRQLRKQPVAVASRIAMALARADAA
jgi:very-short-patch-repair endonuclease